MLNNNHNRFTTFCDNNLSVSLACGYCDLMELVMTELFATYWDMQRIRGSTRMRYINLLLLTYLLTDTGLVSAREQESMEFIETRV